MTTLQHTMHSTSKAFVKCKAFAKLNDSHCGQLISLHCSRRCCEWVDFTPGRPTTQGQLTLPCSNSNKQCFTQAPNVQGTPCPLRSTPLLGHTSGNTPTHMNMQAQSQAHHTTSIPHHKPGLIVAADLEQSGLTVDPSGHSDPKLHCRGVGGDPEVLLMVRPGTATPQPTSTHTPTPQHQGPNRLHCTLLLNT